ncbi:hypothetical protein ES705_07925 [subsurface metagenome]
MGTLAHITSSFLTSLSLIGVSIYHFIEGDDFLGRVFIFLAIYVFITLFYIIRSFFYLKHNATFNEFIFVFILPIIPVLILLAQMLFGINDAYIVSTGDFVTESINYVFYINMVDFLLLPYFLFSNFLLFRTFIRYPFIRIGSTSEKGIPPKFAGFLLMLIIPTAYIVTSITYFQNLFLLIFGIIYLYSALMALFV